MDGSDHFLSMLDVTSRMRLTSARVYQLIAEDRFPRPVKKGRRSYWQAAEVDRFAARWHLLKAA